MSSINIHPVFDRLVQRYERESVNAHKGHVFWLTGLSGSGKSTVAAGAERQLFEAGRLVRVLDGDNVRTGLNAGLGFSLDDRKENIRRVGEVAKLFCTSGFITICSFVSPTIEIRDFAKRIIGPSDFSEVYVNANLTTCENRDVKGLYAKARAGEIKGFTGVDSPYEAPLAPDKVLHTGQEDVETSTHALLDFIHLRTAH